MALVLTGLVQGMRPVEGIVEEGKRRGERWRSSHWKSLITALVRSTVVRCAKMTNSTPTSSRVLTSHRASWQRTRI